MKHVKKIEKISKIEKLDIYNNKKNVFIFIYCRIIKLLNILINSY